MSAHPDDTGNIHRPISALSQEPTAQWHSSTGVLSLDLFSSEFDEVTIIKISKPPHIPSVAKLICNDQHYLMRFWQASENPLDPSTLSASEGAVIVFQQAILAALPQNDSLKWNAGCCFMIESSSREGSKVCFKVQYDCPISIALVDSPSEVFENQPKDSLRSILYGDEFAQSSTRRILLV
jgi:hypothetical protein